MKTVPRIAIAAAMVALLGLSGCIVDRGYGDRGGRGQGEGSSRRGDDRDGRDADCRGRDSDSERCRRQH